MNENITPHKFSPELHEKYENRDYNSDGLETLRKLKAKTDHPQPLFCDQEQADFEKWKEVYPEEYEILENQKAFYELSPEQQQEVSNAYIAKRMQETAKKIRLGRS